MPDRRKTNIRTANSKVSRHSENAFTTALQVSPSQLARIDLVVRFDRLYRKYSANRPALRYVAKWAHKNALPCLAEKAWGAARQGVQP